MTIATEKSHEETQRLIEYDPVRYISSFRDSTEYHDAYERFFSKKQLHDVTPQEMREVFEDHENARMAFIEFARNGTVLVYRAEQYSSDFNEKIKDYFSILRCYKEGSYEKDRETILALDKFRYRLHNIAVDQLIDDGIVGTSKLGRGLVQIMSVEAGLEEYGAMEGNENKRIQSLID